MHEPTQFEGGIFSDEITGGRASAAIELTSSGVQAQTTSGQRFFVSYRECQLDIGGATGRMVFCRTVDKRLNIFCEDRRFAAALEHWSGGELRDRLTSVRGLRRSEDRRWRRLLCIGVAATLLCLVAGYYGLLAFAKASISALPISIDEKIGTMAFDSLDLKGSQINDKVIIDAVREIVARIEPHSELKGLKFDVRVIDGPEVNAFCLPGGRIVVYTGLLRKAESAEQVAGVLSHEMAHAIKRHGLRNVMQSLGVVVAVQVLVGDMGGLVALGVELGKSAALTSYSRESETEADLTGVRMLLAAEIDPKGMTDFFELLKDDGKEIPDTIAWLSTHPQLENRIATINGTLAKLAPQEYRDFGFRWDDIREQLKNILRE